jgi:hypothetical protein
MQETKLCAAFIHNELSLIAPKTPAPSYPAFYDQFLNSTQAFWCEASGRKG